MSLLFFIKMTLKIVILFLNYNYLKKLMKFFFVHEYANEHWSAAIKLAWVFGKKSEKIELKMLFRLQKWHRQSIRLSMNRFHAQLGKEVCLQFHLLGISNQ